MFPYPIPQQLYVVVVFFFFFFPDMHVQGLGRNMRLMDSLLTIMASEKHEAGVRHRHMGRSGVGMPPGLRGGGQIHVHSICLG